MLPKIQRKLDSLDFEIVERAFESAWSALKETGFPADVDSDEELEATLRRELIEIARIKGVTEPIDELMQVGRIAPDRE